MTAFDPSLAAAIAAQSVPLSADHAPLSADREAAIREHVATTKNFSIGNLAARDLLAERYAARLEAELCQCDPVCEGGEYLHAADCPVVEVQMRTFGCLGFEGNPVAPDMCAGCHEPRDSHEEAAS